MRKCTEQKLKACNLLSSVIDLDSCGPRGFVGPKARFGWLAEERFEICAWDQLTWKIYGQQT